MPADPESLAPSNIIFGREDGTEWTSVRHSALLMQYLEHQIEGKPHKVGVIAIVNTNDNTAVHVGHSAADLRHFAATALMIADAIDERKGHN
jgi:hypothetical protein